MTTVLVTDHNFDDLDLEKEVFENNGIEMRSIQSQDPQEIINSAIEVGAEGLLVQYANITEDIFEQLPQLEAVSIYGIGVDNINIETAQQNDVIVTNVPNYCLDEVAEHALAHILALERKITHYTIDVRDGHWDWTNRKPLYRIRGKTVGIVGGGSIGRTLIKKLSGLGVEIQVYDPYLSEDALSKYDAKLTSFDNLVANADIISIHTPLSGETEGLFGREEFEKMKSSSILINTARGPIVDTHALSEAIVDGEIRGAGLDVLPEEPPDESPVFDLEAVSLTPHVAWYSEESFTELRSTAAKEISRVLNDQPPNHPVQTD